MTQHPIAAFLHARLDELEQKARAAGDETTTWYLNAEDNLHEEPGSPVACGPYGGGIDPEGEHIAAHDPAFVLADIAAKRRIVAEHHLVPAAAPQPAEPAHGCETCHSHSEYSVGAFGPCTTLKLLALPFAQHPDYQETWRP